MGDRTRDRRVPAVARCRGRRSRAPVAAPTDRCMGVDRDPVAVTMAVALTYGQTRFRAPAEPGLVVLSAVALVATYNDGLVATGRQNKCDRYTPEPARAFWSPSPVTETSAGLHVVIIGAGPAGLTAAYQLVEGGRDGDDPRGRRRRRRHQPHGRARRLALRHRRPPLLHQGASRSTTSGSRSSAPDDFLRRPRMSRIFYQGKLYDYPIEAVERAAEPRLRRGGALRRVVRLGADPAAEGPDEPRGLLRRRASAGGSTSTSSRRYNEKVWGVPRRELSADFGAQRIKNMSLFRAGWEAIKPKALKRRAGQVEAGHQPHRGVQLPEVRAGRCGRAAAEMVTDARARRCIFEHEVVRIRHARRRGVRGRRASTADGDEHAYPCTHVISSMPMSALARRRWTRRSPTTVARRGRRPPLPRLHDRRARRAGGVLVPRQLDLHPRSRRARSGGSRTSARGRRTW